MGAWIEMESLRWLAASVLVAPRVGAWIEISADIIDLIVKK